MSDILEPKVKSIYTKLHAIMSEVDYIQKDKKNDFHKYNYASEQAIKQTIHPLLVKHGVIFTIDITSTEVVNSLTTAYCQYTFIDIETGDQLMGTFVGQGEDKGDKGIWKAITGIIKYIMTSTFLIPTGDDPEKESKPPIKKIEGTLAQKKLIKQLMDAKGYTVEIMTADGIVAGETPVKEVIDYLVAAKALKETEFKPDFSKEATDHAFDDPIDFNSPEVPIDYGDEPNKAALRDRFGR